jgi:hypothetical protein
MQTWIQDHIESEVHEGSGWPVNSEGGDVTERHNP